MISKLFFYAFKKTNCPMEPKCRRTVYKIRETMLSDGEITHSSNGSTLIIQLESPEVQNIVDNYSYEFPSFVGEVGGTLGLFLGLSVFSFVEFAEYLIRKIYSV